MICRFSNLDSQLEFTYSGSGNSIAQQFYIPVLRESKNYWRLSGYFSIESLAITAAGLAGFIKNEGKMRLVVGAHDVGRDIALAHSLSQNEAEALLEEIAQKIAGDLDRIPEIFAQDRLRALAWMLANGTLEIRVAIPKRTYQQRGNGIFHEKLLILQDEEGCTISAIGSANETRSAYEVNGEALTLHMSWLPGGEPYVQKHLSDFGAIWNDRHPDYHVFPLPEALRLKLRERFYRPEPPEQDPAEPEVLPTAETFARLTPLARLMRELGTLNQYTHLGLGPVRLYPHQTFTADFALAKYPYRCLLADEVGLGKTLEAGAIIKRLLDERQVERILILAPKNVARQWMDELYTHFGVRFWLFESGPTRRFIGPDQAEVRLQPNDSPFDYPGIDRVLMSWHYARRDPVRTELAASQRGFDLVVLDEAHAARMKRQMGRLPEPTKLHDLGMEIGISAPHVLLLTATPVQLRSLEALDLLRILGIGGRWVHEENFERFFAILQKDDDEVEEDEWTFALQMVQSFVVGHLEQREIERIVAQTVPPTYIEDVLRMIGSGGDFGRVASLLKDERVVIPQDTGGLVYQALPETQSVLRQLIMRFSPFQWFMVRNTRERLTSLGFQFPERIVTEEEVELDPEHEDLLERLNDYLKDHYAAYEKLIRKENRGTIGFVRCIYHQRFVSSFAAAYQTIVNRMAFLTGLLERDMEAVERVAEKIFDDEEDEEIDEFALIESVEDMLGRPEVEQVLRKELSVLEPLREALSAYAPGAPSLNDPKMRAIREVIHRFYHNEGRKVLVFSKYTDTITALHRYLLMTGFSADEIALYTGGGGRVYDPTRDDYAGVGKEEVRKALEGDRVGIVLCTEAASEGLNLQAASGLVNVDMPWNPARVEQRIGRIDRLGQQNSTVSVVNVWYPVSIEGSMYAALFDRKEIYLLVVGPAQEIFSQRLRQAFDHGARGERLREFVSETIRTIDEVKDQVARSEGVFAGKQWHGEGIDDDAVVDRTKQFVDLAAPALGLATEVTDDRLVIRGVRRALPADLEKWNGAVLIPGRANALTPAHPIVQWLITEIITGAEGVPRPQAESSLYILRDCRRVGTLTEIDRDGIPTERTGTAVLAVLDRLIAQAGGES